MIRKLLPWMGLIMVMALVLSGCVSLEDRIKSIRAQYPQWDEETVRKVAARQVEVGMTREMVRAALGDSDTAPVYENGEEKWGYMAEVQRGQAAYFWPVFFVYFKEGKVVRTRGNRSRLIYW